MFKFLSVKSNVDTRYPPTLLVAALSGVLFLTGCQQSETPPVPDDSQTSEQTSVEDTKPMPKSDSAAARIEQFQPIYVTQAQSLQRRLQAEYESLQAADASDSEELLLLNTTDDNSQSTDANNEVTVDDTSSIASTAATSSETGELPGNPANNTTDNSTNADAEVDANTSTEVGERDLTVLKRISLEPRKPVMLTEEQIIERYQQTMDALYQPVTTPLSAEDSDTLINMATLVPQLFEHAEIAGRVSAKSPALARLIIQHQVWEQIEAQQVIDMQQMKQKQQQEFEALMAKFNETIEGYDEQIAKYEQTLEEFQ
ncbi:hypothetical protein [Psychrobacter sp. AOP7-A1-24]|uniref:hypothetical protein n=1 Tax=Psychrobacter sp. AOP7-A1-24 TaxID=3457646 RepID=UPI00402BB684